MDTNLAIRLSNSCNVEMIRAWVLKIDENSLSHRSTFSMSTFRLIQYFNESDGHMDVSKNLHAFCNRLSWIFLLLGPLFTTDRFGKNRFLTESVYGMTSLLHDHRSLSSVHFTQPSNSPFFWKDFCRYVPLKCRNSNVMPRGHIWICLCMCLKPQSWNMMGILHTILHMSCIYIMSCIDNSAWMSAVDAVAILMWK